jgi:hypothetical protein
MNHPSELKPQPRGRLTTQFNQVYRLTDACKASNPGPGVLGMQTVHGQAYKQDPLQWVYRGFGGGGTSGPARWG